MIFYPIHAQKIQKFVQELSKMRERAHEIGFSCARLFYEHIDKVG